jgi:hypothetical protein
MRDDGGRMVGADVMLKDGFELKPVGADAGTPAEQFRRYDVLSVVDVNDQDGMVRFRHIDTRKQLSGNRPCQDAPMFAMKQAELEQHLRALSDPVSGAVEGLALVRPFEYILRHGQVKVDVAALDEFAHSLPVVRRVKLGNLNIVATYDPLCIRGGAPRGVRLTDFDGRPGLTVTLPADEKTRIFVLSEP